MVYIKLENEVISCKEEEYKFCRWRSDGTYEIGLDDGRIGHVISEEEAEAFKRNRIQPLHDWLDVRDKNDLNFAARLEE